MFGERTRGCVPDVLPYCSFGGLFQMFGVVDIPISPLFERLSSLVMIELKLKKGFNGSPFSI